MKILFIANHLKGYDGYSRYTIALMTRLQREGHEVRAIVYESSEKYRELEEVLLKPPQAYLVNPFTIFAGARAVSACIQRWKPDCIHVTVEPFGHLVPFMSLGSIPVILTLHGTFAYIPHLLHAGPRKLLAKLWSALLFRRANVIVAVSSYTKRHVLSLYPRLKSGDKDFRVISNGVEPISVIISDDQLFRRFEYPSLLHVGGVTERKGVVEALQGIARYRDKYGVELPFRIVGSVHENTRYGRDVRDAVAKLGLNNVQFVGRVSEQELAEEYMRASVFLLPNVNRGKEFEGFGIVYLEANLYGIPVLGGKGSGAEDAIKEGESGYLITSTEPEEIADRLHTLFSNKDEYVRFSRSAIAWAEAHTWDVQFSQYRSLYKAQ